MGRLAAAFFGRLGRARFYRDLHGRAVDLLGPGAGRRWIDVGCGPGLVAGLAAARGFRAVGIDRDPAMIAAARAALGEVGIDFRVGDLDTLGTSVAEVVSAASLVIGLADRAAGIDRLVAAVAPRGALVVIETTAALRPLAALARSFRDGFGGGGWLLLLWAIVRRGVRPVEAVDLARPGWRLDRMALLDEMVVAWILRRGA
jgi:SAM-dependent methyltransferase